MSAELKPYKVRVAFGVYVVGDVAGFSDTEAKALLEAELVESYKAEAKKPEGSKKTEE